MTFWKKSGTLLSFTGVIHNAVGVIAGWKILAGIVHDGLINAINSENHLDRNAIFWFLFSGSVLMLLGKLMQDFIETHHEPAPAYVGYCILLLSGIGCLIMPLSGFWLLLPQGLIIMKANRKIQPKTRSSRQNEKSF